MCIVVYKTLRVFLYLSSTVMFRFVDYLKLSNVLLQALVVDKVGFKNIFNFAHRNDQFNQWPKTQFYLRAAWDSEQNLSSQNENPI